MSKEITEHTIPFTNDILTTGTGRQFAQTHEIPVTVNEETWPLHTFYVRFNVPPMELVAGGEDIEIASQRIRAQMIHHFEMASEATRKPEPPPNARRSLEIVSQYFRLKT